MGQRSFNKVSAGTVRRIRRPLGLLGLSFWGLQVVAACAGPTGDCSPTLPCPNADLEEIAPNRETSADDELAASDSSDDLLAAPGRSCDTSSDCQAGLVCAQSVCCLDACNGPGQTCGTDGICREACGAGTADCNGLGSDRCEASLSSGDSCGACGVQCASSQACGATGCVEPQVTLALSLGAEVVNLAFDNANNLYVTGALRQRVDLGGTTVAPLGASSIFVAKYSAAGNLAWFRVIDSHVAPSIDGPAELESGTGKSIAVDERGNVYVTGDVRGAANFGGGVIGGIAEDAVELSNATASMFVASYDAAGGFRWANIYDSAFAGATGEGLAIAAGSRSVYFAARGGPAVDFGGGAVTGDDGNSQNLFVVALDRATGSHAWSRALPYDELGAAEFTQLVLDSQERLYLSGWWRGVLDFGSDPLTGARTIARASQPSTDAGFIASYSPVNGALRWLRLQDNYSNSHTIGLAVDDQDLVYAAGSFVTSVLGDGALDIEAALTRRLFLVSYDNEGSRRFAAGTGTGHVAPATSAAATGIGVRDHKIYVSVNYSRLIANSEEGTELSSTDAGLISFDAFNGAFRWVQSFATNGFDATVALANNALGPVVAAKAEHALSIDGRRVEPIGELGTLLIRVTE